MISIYTPSGQRIVTYSFAPIPPSGGMGADFLASISSSDQYFGARRLAVMDQLGSIATTSSGTSGTFYRWGEPKGSMNPQDTWSYATYWRDSASSLDYANNRYYSNAYGRFMTPDPYQASGQVRIPQSWNRYAYVNGDPANGNDALGLYLPLSSESGGGEGWDYGGSGASGGLLDGGSGTPGAGIDPSWTITWSVFLQIGIGSGGSSTGTSSSSSDDLECEIELLSQEIQPAGYKTPFNHTSTEWSGYEIATYIDGVPQNGYLTAVIGSKPYYSTPQTVVWSSGFSSANCTSLFNILSSAESFPDGKYLYGLVEQNSNSLTHALLVTQNSVLPWYWNVYEGANPLTPGWLWPLSW